MAAVSETPDLEQPEDHSEVEQPPEVPYPQEHSEISSDLEQGEGHSVTGSSSESDIPAPSPIKQHHFSLAVESRVKVNKYLRTIGETPIAKRELQSKKYSKKKLQTITKMMQKAGIEEKPTVDYEIIAQLKEKYATAQRSEKVQILTILPKSWSIRKIEAEFGASNFMVRKAKELVREKGIMCTPNPKPGRSLPQTTVEEQDALQSKRGWFSLICGSYIASSKISIQNKKLDSQSSQNYVQSSVF